MKITLGGKKMQGVVLGSNNFHASDFQDSGEKLFIRLLFGAEDRNTP